MISMMATLLNPLHALQALGSGARLLQRSLLEGSVAAWEFLRRTCSPAEHPLHWVRLRVAVTQGALPASLCQCLKRCTSPCSCCCCHGPCACWAHLLAATQIRLLGLHALGVAHCWGSQTYLALCAGERGFWLSEDGRGELGTALQQVLEAYRMPCISALLQRPTAV